VTKFSVKRRGFAASAIAAAALVLSGAIPGAGLPRALAADPAAAAQIIGPDEIVYGKADAPVTIIEYASLTCPHCAAFHTDIMPGVKQRLLDTGKARLVFRDFPLDQLALRAAVMVRCNAGDRRQAMLDVVFSSQATWRAAADPVAALMNIGRASGMTDQDLETCFNNQPVIDGVIQQRLDAEKAFKVGSTPSFVIGGKLYSGGLSVEQLAVLVESQKP
jgi:protein-disulfide isomerase